MLRKNAWVGLLFLLVFLPSTLMAQGLMHGKWWYDNSIRQELKLTDDETKVLDEKYTESRRKMIDFKSEVEKQRFEMDILLGAQDMDKQKILERYESLEQARRKLSRERFEMFMAIREIIGAERFQELKLMQRDQKRKGSKGFAHDGSYRDRGRYRD
jgi:Spy/CpxP family protein refolding chaperone